MKEESELFYYQGKPLLAVASHLSIGDFKSAIQVLVRNNELYLAYYFSKFFYPEALNETALYLYEKAERFFQTDICMNLLNDDISDKNTANLLKRRLMNSKLTKEQLL